MTQKEKVLGMLKAAGKFGVRSDTYIKDYMPRAAARIQELKDEGYEITSEREGKYTRWTLVGSSAGKSPPACETAEEPALPTQGSRLAGELGPNKGAPVTASAASSERTVPNMFDPDADWGEAA